ncbi:MAG: ABC transporter permease, partial [Flavobacteriales bacterium]
MFDSDKWIEIFATMAKNPLRTFLTGLSVGIGVFILVVFQGLGFGLQNGAMQELQDDAINSLWIRKGRTSMPYAGLKANRELEFKSDDLNYILDEYEGTNVYSGRLGIWGSAVSFGNESQNFGVRCVHPGHLELERSNMTNGRYINNYDVAEERKVAVLGQNVLEDL